MKPKNTDISPRSAEPSVNTFQGFARHGPEHSEKEPKKNQEKNIYFSNLLFTICLLSSGSRRHVWIFLASFATPPHSSLPSGCFQVPKVEELYGLLAFSFTSRGLFVSTDHDVDRAGAGDSIFDLPSSSSEAVAPFVFGRLFSALLLHVLPGCPWSRVLPEGR